VSTPLSPKFRFRGRPYTLFRRTGSDYWYIRACIKGQRRVKSCESDFKKATDHLIPQTSSHDTQKLQREVSRWIREFIPDRNKTLHELRKEFGSQVLKRTGSIGAAAEALGDTVETARAYYLTQLRPAEAFSLSELV
jgi:hypothetical protein